MVQKMRWEDRIGRRLKLQDMHILLATVQWGSMAKAADRLAISQPVVSRSIAGLEHTLGVRLLDRSRRGIEPTIYGRALLTHGLAAFNELRQGVKAIEFLADPTAGELRVGTADPEAGLVCTVIDRLSRKYPRLAFHVKLGPPPDLQDRELRARDIDLIVGRLPSPDPADDIEAEILFHARIGVVAARASPWSRRRKVALAELVNEPWSLPPPETFPGSLIASAFRACGLDVPRNSTTALSVDVECMLVKTGRFLTMLPPAALLFSTKRLSLKLLPVELPIEPWPIGIIKLKNRTLSPVAQLFIDCARDVAKPLTRVASVRFTVP